MTLSNLMNWGGFAKVPAAGPLPIDRYHSGWEHKSHGHGWKSHHGGGGGGKGGGGSGAALSALALLAFLFLINVMQQSLQDNSMTTTTPAPTVFLRDSQIPLNSRTETKEPQTSRQFREEAIDRRRKGDDDDSFYGD